MTIAILEPILGGASAATAWGTVPANTKRKFTKFNAYNGNGISVTIKVFLAPSGAGADGTRCYVDYDIAPRETYTCPEVIGAALNAGGQVYVLGNGVSFNAVATDTLNG